MIYPSHCADCGGIVKPLAKTGRTSEYKKIHAVPLPDDLEIPTCAKCEEEFIDADLAVRLDAILEYRMRMLRYYAGIGSRETPHDILKIIGSLAFKLSNSGLILRSGHAKGADRSFEYNAGLLKQIFRPEDATPEAIELAMQFHPAPHRCDDYAKKLHGRNAQIILGKDLDLPVEVVYCWTSNGRDKGGTGLGMRIAASRGIPIRNLYYPEVIKEIEEILR